MKSRLDPVLATLAFAGVAMLVWYGGPLFAFADRRPLETPLERALLIAAIGLLWALRSWWRARAAQRRNRALFDALAGEASADGAATGAAAAGARAEPIADATRVADEATLRNRFDAALQSMREVGGDEPRGALARLLGGRRYVYQLPWYLFIGSPGSGKTTALLNSGLRFPLAERLGSEKVAGVGGTRHCDWWFTDRAVLIDTAGRYTTQDSDARRDAHEWSRFLSLLKLHRPRQPINGVLVTVSVPDLVQASDDELQRQAVAVRERLRELRATLQTGFPAYLLVTKVDLIAGFVETFGALDAEQRAQVWGASFDYGLRDDPAATLAQAAAELQALDARLGGFVLERIGEERDPARRALAVGFREQFPAIAPRLLAFARAAFGGDATGGAAGDGAPAAPLRGLYFTSGTQEGSPIDRILGSIGRSFGLRGRVLPPARGAGRAYFLQRLLTDVVFAEAALAGTNLQWERRRARRAWAALAASVALAVAAVAAWGWSARNNAAYLAEVDARIARLRAALPALRSGAPVRELLPVYAALRGLPRTAQVDPETAAAPAGYGFGLYQGDKLAQASDQAYHGLLQRTLAPALAARLVVALRATAGRADEQYETLRVYAMMLTPGKTDRAAVRRWAARALQDDAEMGQGDDERRELLVHVDALLARNAFQQAIAPDQGALAQARAAQARRPLAQRVLGALHVDGVGDAVRAFRIDEVAGATAPVLLAQRDGGAIEPVPAAYTAEGFARVATQLPELMRRFADEESWVLGIGSGEAGRRLAEPAALAAASAEAMQLYLVEYANRWEKWLADIALRKPASLAEAVQAARVLASPESPLPPLLRAATAQVDLDARATATGVPASALAPLAQRFEGLRRFVDGLDRPGAPLAQSAALLNAFYAAASADTGGARGGATRVGDALAELPAKLRLEAGRMPQPARAVFDGMAEAAGTQLQRQLREDLSASMRASISEFCERAIGGRYPFTAGSRTDVSPSDFARLFGPGGLFDDFFQKRLAPLVDTGSRPWRFRSGAEASATDAGSLAQFQRAADFRAAFFPGGLSMPAARIEMRPLEMDPSILQFSLDVDGQVLKYAHGPSLPKALQWPGPDGTQQIRAQLFPPPDNGAPTIAYAGPWALLRMFEDARITPLGQPDRFRAALQVAGHSVSFEVVAGSVNNPFRLAELRAFRCPGNL